MAIASRKPSAPAVQVPVVPHVQTVRAQTNVIDTAQQPFDSLLKYVEGSRWTVDYYSQINGLEGQTHTQDTGMLGVYQQYQKIKGLEIRVEQDLSQEQDPENKGFTVRGSGHIPFSIIPNEGDMFIADVGDGRMGCFAVIRTEKKSIFRESVYQVEYVMRYFTAEQPDTYLKDLESKVTRTLNYLHLLAESNQYPLIADESLHALERMHTVIFDLKKAWMNWFFSNEFATVLLPVEGARAVYDPYLTKAVRSIFKTTDALQVDRMKVLNVQDMDRASLPTIWDALLRREASILNYCQRHMGTVSSKSFSRDAYTAPMFYQGLTQVVHPMPDNSFSDQRFNLNSKDNMVVPLTGALVTSIKGDFVALASDNLVKINGKELTPVLRVSESDMYLFSSAVYDNKDVAMSALEVLVKNYLHGKQNDPVIILNLLERCWKWGATERFYLIPVLFILAEHFQRSF